MIQIVHLDLQYTQISLMIRDLEILSFSA